ncbi:hypothetical protein N9K04_05255 [Gammaproteobacteria bacterium]|nr:hypothetical protein [Gammaproteobacteria bacterium]
MNSQSTLFIKDTILKLLGAIGSEKEIKKYIEKYSSPEQRFAIIKVGGSVIQNDLDNLVTSLVFSGSGRIKASDLARSRPHAFC